MVPASRHDCRICARARVSLCGSVPRAGPGVRKHPLPLAPSLSLSRAGVSSSGGARDPQATSGCATLGLGWQGAPVSLSPRGRGCPCPDLPRGQRGNPWCPSQVMWESV